MFFSRSIIIAGDYNTINFIYLVEKLIRYSTNFTTKYFNIVKRVAKYLANTKDISLKYDPKDSTSVNSNGKIIK